MFIETSEFHRRWTRLGLGEEDLRELQAYLLEHPDAGDVVQAPEESEKFDGHAPVGESQVECVPSTLTLRIERPRG